MEIKTINFSDRITKEMKDSRRMVIDGDLWLDGKGLAIQKPTNDPAKMLEIREGFATQNVLEEISDRRRDGILGREPRYNLLPESGEELSETEVEEIEKMLAAVVDWWNSRSVLETMKTMLSIAHCERRCSVRPYASTDAFTETDGDKTLKTDFGDYGEALDSLFLGTVSADSGGVFREKDTERPFSIYKYKTGERDVTELSFVSPVDGKTHLTQLSEDDLTGIEFLQENFPNSLADYAQKLINQKAKDETVNYEPLDLRGNLYLHELDLEKPFINEAMKSLQKQISLILTMDGRNIYAAGIRKEHHLNTAPPQEKKIVDGKPQLVDAPLRQGAGVRNFLQGVPIIDEQGKIIGRANPSVVIVDPVSSETFIESADDKRARILAMADQLHVLMSDSAAASGISRKEARDEFRKSLVDAKSPLDKLGRYIIEFAVMYAANLTGKADLFKNLRCNFDCIVDAGQPSPEEKEENRKAYQNGEISLETLRSLNGVEDTDGEDAKIKQEDTFVFNLLAKAGKAYAEANGAIPLSVFVSQLPIEADKKTEILDMIAAVPPPTPAPNLNA